MHLFNSVHIRYFVIAVLSAVCFFGIQICFAEDKLSFGDEKLDSVITELKSNEANLNKQNLDKQKQALAEKKEDELQVYLKKNCNADYLKNYALTPLDAGYNYVISNFIKGVFNLYQDPNAQKNAIALAYNLSLKESPVVGKLNGYFFNRIKKELIELVDTTVTKIKLVKEEDGVAEFIVDFDYSLLRPTLLSADDSRLSSIDPKTLKKSVKIYLKKSVIIMNDLIKNDKITVDKHWFNNPFQLYVTDYELLNN